jgi:hypothetical protein
MTVASQSQFLRVYTATGGTTLHRWQSYYAYRTVEYNGANWVYLPFEASGITAGQTGDESGVSITMPALKDVVDAVESSIAFGYFWRLSIYQFTPGLEAEQVLIETFTGEIVGAVSTLSGIRIDLGSTLSPVGAQIPPRTLTTNLIGKGCRL